MKQYECNIIHRTEDGKIISLDKVESDNIFELNQQISFILLNLLQQVHKNEISELRKRLDNDDIPF